MPWPDDPARQGAGCSALVLTLDLQVIGQRHRTSRTASPPRQRPTLANLSTSPPSRAGASACWARGATPSATSSATSKGQRHEVPRLLDQRAVRPAPLLGRRRLGQGAVGRQAHPQGIMEAEDARLAAQAGADAIVVSKPRRAASSTARPAPSPRCPRSLSEVGSELEVWMDGGIRSGQDVLKAWALGARGTSTIGRAAAYGLGAMGEAGVTKALQILHKELDVTMAFCGPPSCATSAKTSWCPAPSKAEHASHLIACSILPRPGGQACLADRYPFASSSKPRP